MSLQKGSSSPDLEAETSESSINFHDWIGHTRAVLFSQQGSCQSPPSASL
jgi:alkyl hydroperoxide reductase subunit AhpC